MSARCRCGGREDATVEARPRRAGREVQRMLCLACWDDPNPAYADCQHGGHAAQE